MCADCYGTCKVCGAPAPRRGNGQYGSRCAEHEQWKNPRKLCAKCGEVRDGTHNMYCRDCFREYSRQWVKDNPEKVQAKMWRHDLKRTYGITPEQWVEMLEQQNGTCAICDGLPGTGRKFHVDHCHATGKVRSLLCGRCNVALGMAGEDPGRLRKMADYLECFA